MRRFAGPLVLVLIFLLLPAPILAQCGVERWSVKTGTDADVGKINLGSTTTQSIVTMRGWTAPSPIPANNRVSPYETTQWVLNATLTQYKAETDSDYHLVLSDASGNTLIAEIPSPSCVGSGSPLGPGIQNARNQFDAKFTATSSFKTANVPVQVKGIGMFDFLHGQTGVAPNGIEIHAVLDIIFNPTGADFTIGSSPGAISVVQGTSGTSTISTTKSGTFSSAISLSASGLPSGATASFSPSSIAAPGTGSSTATITTSTSTPAGTYPITVTGTGGGLTHTTTVTLTVTAGGGGGVTTLTNGVAVTGLSGATGAFQFFKITVPSGQTSLVIPISGGTGDGDLYVKLGAQPTSTVYDYRSILTGNGDSVTVTNPAAGDWYIGLYGYAAYSGVTLKATYSGGSGGDTTAPTTSITSPAAGTIVSSTTTVSASASDNVGVTKVEFYLDGVLQSTDTTSPYSWSWNTATASNGSHTLTTKAYDAAANVGTSTGVAVTVSNATAQQLLGNPGFETGTASPWVAATGVVSNSTSEAAHGGTWKAWMDGYGSTHTDTLYQQVTIPSTSTTATLTFWLHVDTAETTTTSAYDTLKVQIRNSSGTVLATLATYSNLNSTTGFAQKSFDLSAYKGQTIQVYLVGVEDTTLQTSFVVDDFALNVQ
jgi:hypothetical protein